MVTKAIVKGGDGKEFIIMRAVDDPLIIARFDEGVQPLTPPLKLLDIAEFLTAVRSVRTYGHKDWKKGFGEVNVEFIGASPALQQIRKKGKCLAIMHKSLQQVSRGSSFVRVPYLMITKAQIEECCNGTRRIFVFSHERVIENAMSGNHRICIFQSKRNKPIVSLAHSWSTASMCCSGENGFCSIRVIDDRHQGRSTERRLW